MPFITEEIWHAMDAREAGASINLTTWPKAGNIDTDALAKGEYSKEIISSIRDIRKKAQIKNADKLAAFVLTDNLSVYEDFIGKIEKLGGLESIVVSDTEVSGAQSFIVKGQQFYIELNQAIDVESKRLEMEEELKYTRGFLISVQKKLSNTRFVDNAPEKVVAMERQKLADAESKIKLLEESLARL